MATIVTSHPDFPAMSAALAAGVIVRLVVERWDEYDWNYALEVDGKEWWEHEEMTPDERARWEAINHEYYLDFDKVSALPEWEADNIFGAERLVGFILLNSQERE